MILFSVAQPFTSAIPSAECGVSNVLVSTQTSSTNVLPRVSAHDYPRPSSSVQAVCGSPLLTPGIRAQGGISFDLTSDEDFDFDDLERRLARVPCKRELSFGNIGGEAVSKKRRMFGCFSRSKKENVPPLFLEHVDETIENVVKSSVEAPLSVNSRNFSIRGLLGRKRSIQSACVTVSREQLPAVAPSIPNYLRDLAEVLPGEELSNFNQM